MMNYFDEPKQVMFADPDNEGEWIVGIAYKDEIICACCGGVFEVADVLEAVPEGKQAIFPYEDWADISAEIVFPKVSLHSSQKTRTFISMKMRLLALVIGSMKKKLILRVLILLTSLKNLI